MQGIARPQETRQTRMMKLLSYNIQYGFGADGHYDLARAARVIAKADIAAIQEVDRHWSRSDFDDQPALLQALLPDHYSAYAPGFDMDASFHLHGRIVNRRRQFGPMIFSRWPLIWTRTHLLPMLRMIDPINTQTCALEACIATPMGAIRVMCLHLAHVGVEERLAQIAHLQSLQLRSPAAGPPWSGSDDEPARNWTEGQAEPPFAASEVWMGDFNCEPGSQELAMLTAHTPYHPDARYAGGLVNATTAAGAKLHTHSKVIAGARRLRQLDHMFVSPDLVGNISNVWSDVAEDASDHYPLWMTFAR